MTADPQAQPTDTEPSSIEGDGDPNSTASTEADNAATTSGADASDSEDAESKKASSRRRSGKKRKSGPGKTPGERLAAAKAARAARKAKERGRDAEVLETEALKRADRVGDWIANHRGLLLGGLGVSFAAVAGFLLWSAQENSTRAEASAALWEAVETANARIVDEDEQEEDTADSETESSEPTAASLSERATMATDRYQAVLEEHAGTEAATWAQLGLGSEWLTLGEADKARDAFSRALQIAGDDAFVEFRALEGIAFAYELEEKWDEAADHLEQLRATGDASLEDIADYHLARVNLQRGETDRAKELLSELIARRDSEREDEPELSFLENQARLRLTEIDPSFSSRSAPDLSSSLGNLDSLPPEVRELLRKQGGGAVP